MEKTIESLYVPIHQVKVNLNEWNLQQDSVLTVCTLSGYGRMAGLLEGFPPLKHPTHALGPVLDLINRRTVKVHCFGSGQMREELVKHYGNPYPVETAIYQLEDSDIAVELTRTMFHTARAYSGCFNVYGEKMTFEWQQIEEELPILMRMGELVEKRGRPITVERFAAPDRQDLLPKEIARFTQSGVYDASNPHLSFLQGGGHGGSHPHLVHEFISSITEGRKPHVDEIKAANWTAAGICAHESAMNGGRRLLFQDLKRKISAIREANNIGRVIPLIALRVNTAPFRMLQ